MILADCHVHSEFSADSDAPMEGQIESAIQAGLKILTFTDHYDMDFPPVDGQYFLFDIHSYFEKIADLKTKYQDKITLRYGIELGIQPYLGEECRHICEQYAWDFVIASTHLIFGKDPYYPEVFQEYGEEVCYREYFHQSFQNMQAFSDFSSYGHLDYVVRYGPNKNKEYTYEKYREEIDACLRELISKGKALEVNTSGYRAGLGYPNPQLDVLTRYRELGGELITIGSDAHTEKQVAGDFEKAEELLKTAGFRYYAVYQNLQPEMMRL